MRFMAIVKATKESEAGEMPKLELINAMGKFNEEMIKAGVMLAGEGLHPSSKGARVRFSGAKRTVIDGPFAETKELIAGFWLLQVKSKEEAIAAMRGSLERHGISTVGWWETQLDLCLLGTLVQFGWEKALGADDELGWWCDRAREGGARL